MILTIAKIMKKTIKLSVIIIKCLEKQLHIVIIQISIIS